MRQTSPTHNHDTNRFISTLPERKKLAYNEMLVANGNGEIAIESDAEVIRVVALIGDDMFQQCRLVPEDFRKTSAVT